MRARGRQGAGSARPARRGLSPAAAAVGTLAITLAACVPVTVNVTFPQEKLDTAARHIEEIPAQPAAAPPPTASPSPAPSPAPPSGQSRTIEVTPRLDTRSP